MAKNLYGTLIAAGVLAMLMFQVFVNVGMTIGIMPITGVPLPLMSYGGSSVLVTFLALGLLSRSTSRLVWPSRPVRCSYEAEPAHIVFTRLRARLRRPGTYPSRPSAAGLRCRRCAARAGATPKRTELH